MAKIIKGQKMKNKKAQIILFGVFLLFLIIIVLILVWGLLIVFNEVKTKNAYTKFCEERPFFCYCDNSPCEFKRNMTSQKEEKELCDLAKELNDKRILFRFEC